MDEWEHRCQLKSICSRSNGSNLWADKTVKFLDPFTKSGVFLREITSRLTKGLAVEGWQYLVVREEFKSY